MVNHISTILCLCLLFSITESYLYVTNLTVEYLRNPKAVDSANPRLGWIPLIGSAKNGTFPNDLDQAAYQILVATNQHRLSIGNPDLWNSNKTYSDRTFGVTYQGKELKPGQTVFWTVRVWDQRDVMSYYAAVSKMNMLEKCR